MEQHLQKIAKWGQFVGIIMIIAGGISALAGLFFFLIGAVPGIIQIFLGIYVYRTGENARILLRQYNAGVLEELTVNYAKYLKLNGIFTIIMIVFVILLFIPLMFFLPMMF